MPGRPDPRSRYEVRDVEVLRLLAHPLRARLLGALRLEGEATASELGRRLGESSGATSYHLRQLARFGLVEESPEQASRRERVWRAAHALTAIDPRDLPDDEEGGAQAEFSRLQLARLTEQSQRWIQRRPHADPAWEPAAGFSDLVVRLTPQALETFAQRSVDLLHDLEEASAGDPSSAWVSVFLTMLPQDDQEIV